MDFVGGLPRTRKGHDYLFVVIDGFIKMCILMARRKIIKMQEVTNLLFEKVWVHFWLPSIISNRDTKFLNAFSTTLWEKMDAKLKRSTTLHPHTYVQIEMVNTALVMLLRGYYQKHPNT